jgi:hypothetical protein
MLFPERSGANHGHFGFAQHATAIDREPPIYKAQSRS